jgi:hypothetical protein
MSGAGLKHAQHWTIYAIAKFAAAEKFFYMNLA